MLNILLRWLCWGLGSFLVAIGLLHRLGEGEPWISLFIFALGIVLIIAGISIKRLQKQQAELP